MNVYAIPLLQENLSLIEDRMRSRVSPQHLPDLRAALDHLLSAGGKRIRPTVIVLAGTMLGAPREKIISLGAAVEMLHTATLVHDDLIDGALLRRGMPTLNARWSPAATVLTGDYLFACAAHLAAEIGSLEIMEAFSETLMVIVNGELSQLFGGRGLWSREHYYQRIYAKTASLFEMSTRAVGLISSMERREVELLAEMGHHIGMAFQIMDDVLDFTSEQLALGKPVGSDLRQGLITLPAIYYIEEYPDDPYATCESTTTRRRRRSSISSWSVTFEALGTLSQKRRATGISRGPLCFFPKVVSQPASAFSPNTSRKTPARRVIPSRMVSGEE
jgi:geranylgeranyl pyrophosphate synthase